MKVVTTIKEMQEVIWKQKGQSKSIGFVPTMGFLHEGHLTLIKEAKQENDLVVLSIFVNPLQFGPGEDFETYPRDFERDQALAESEKVDFLFYPTPKEMYPANLSVTLTVHDRTDVLCGKSRPGHFDGVVTVVSKLFHIIQPTRAYFGKKDAQQLAVIEGLTKDLNFSVQIVPVDIVREKDGLAKSSRNVNLSFQDRMEAPILYQSLMAAKTAIEAGERSPENIIELVSKMLLTAERSKIDYVEVLSYPELEPIDNLAGRFIIALAVKFEQVRLIDNLIIELK
jgi:pantoate--beta-alanine ligase